MNVDNVEFRSYEQNDNLEESEIKFILFASLNKDLVSYKQALETAECEQWKKAAKEELKSIDENEVLMLVLIELKL